MLRFLILAAASACTLTTPGQPTGAPHQQTWDAALGACRWAARCVPWLGPVGPGDDLVYRCADGASRTLEDSGADGWEACERQLSTAQACGDQTAPEACLPWWPDGVVTYPEEP